MARKKILPSLTWKEAPDTIDPEILSKILGCCIQKATEFFNAPDFPLLDKIGLKADKDAVRMYIQGFRIKNNPKLCVEQMILMELKKINQREEVKLNEK